MSWLSDFLFGSKAEAPPIGDQIKSVAEAYAKYGPQLFDSIAAAEKQQAATDFDSAKTYSPQYAALEAQLQNEFGPQIAAAQAKSAAVSGNAAAGLEQQLIKQYGPETAKAILATVESADPRGVDAKNKLKSLYDTYTANLSPTLNGSETAAINRSLAQQNPNQVGSQLETIANAQTFGNAGTAKLQQFGEGAARAASLIPSISSGVNPFSVSTLGRDSSNSSASIVDKLTNNQYNASGQAIGVNGTNQLFGLQNQANAIDATNKDRGFLQAWTRGMAGLSSAASAAANFSAACWIAREVFGFTNPQWLLFRRWLFANASPRLLSWYIKNGPRVAVWLRNRPATKLKIRTMMLEVIS